MRLLICLWLCFVSSAALAAGEEYRIAAIVNDQVISSIDVDQRMALVIGTTGLEDSAAVRERLASQVLRALVDEAIQRQEAKRYNVAVSKKEIAEAIASIERARGKSPGSLKAHLDKHGLSLGLMEEQVEAQLLWNKLVNRRLRRDVVVSEAEVDRALKTRLGGALERLHLATLTLPVDKPENEANTRQVAQELVSQIRQGANFDAISSQLSESSQIISAWVTREQIEETLARALSNLSPGEVTEPVRGPAGYQIVRLIDKQVQKSRGVDAEVALKQIVLKLNYDAQMREVDVLMDIARQVAKHPGSCTEMGIAGLEDFEGLNIKVDYVRTTLSSMSPEVQPIVNALPVTGISEPFATPDGIRLLMLCERIDLPPAQADREEVRAQLLLERLELEANKYLRNLRREAFIDIRS